MSSKTSRAQKVVGDRESSNIGPGYYDEGRSEKITKARAPAFGGGKADRSVSANRGLENLTGPGTYDVADGFDKNVQAFTIGVKR
jgi:hypothetical protein